MLLLSARSRLPRVVFAAALKASALDFYDGFPKEE